MSKPADISQIAWEATEGMPARFIIDIAASKLWDIRHTVARAIMKNGAQVRVLIWNRDGEVARAETPFGELVVGKVGIHFGWVLAGVTGWHPAESMESAIVDAEADFGRRVGDCIALNASPTT